MPVSENQKNLPTKQETVMKPPLWLTVVGRSVILAIVIAGVCVAGTGAGKIPITTSSETAQKYFIQGRELSENLRGTESVEYFRKAVEADPDFAMAHLYLAFAAPTTNEFFDEIDKARALMDRVSEGEQLFIKSNVAAAYGKTAESREMLEKLVQLYPEDERALYTLGTDHFVRQEYTDAMKYYERAVKINPDYAPTYNEMGYTHRRMGDMEKAKAAFRKYIELIPDDPNPYDSYAELLLKMGQFDESMAQYQKALDLDPYFTTSHFGIATNLCMKGDYDAAHKHVDEAYNKGRHDAEKRAALTAKAIVYVDQGKHDMAMDVVQKRHYIARESQDPLAMAADMELLGALLIETGKYDSAAIMYMKARDIVAGAELDPMIKKLQDIDYLFEMGWVYTEKAELDKAKEKAQKYLAEVQALRDRNRIRTAHQLMGQIALAEENYEKAVSELKQANLQNPYNHYRLAMAHKGLGDKQKAQEYCDKAANCHAVNNLAYAMIRHKAKKMTTSL
jgi:tetratricopeptide (TPR) repeat protein